MRQGYGYGVATGLTVAAAAIPNNIFGVPISGIMALCTVAGNAVVTLSGGSNVTIALVVGTNIFPLAAVRVVSQTATATYSALG